MAKCKSHPCSLNSVVLDLYKCSYPQTFLVTVLGKSTDHMRLDRCSKSCGSWGGAEVENGPSFSYVVSRKIPSGVKTCALVSLSGF